MPEAVPESPPSYSFACVHCRTRIDALAARFCNCIAKERTLVCPACGRCFCSAPGTFRQNFWLNAPEALWKRRTALSAVAREFVNPKPEAAKRPLVLIVDDELDVRAAAITIVAQLGYGVVVGADGEEGLELARRYHPDAVLTDAFMPRIDGRELAGRIKESPALAKIKVIVMTSLYKSAQQKYEALRTFHVDEYVTKPLDVEQLRKLLSSFVGEGTR